MEDEFRTRSRVIPTQPRTYLIELSKVLARERRLVHGPPERKHEAHVGRKGPDPAVQALHARDEGPRDLPPAAAPAGTAAPPAEGPPDLPGGGPPGGAELAGLAGEGALGGEERRPDGPVPPPVLGLGADHVFDVLAEAPEVLGHLGVAPVARLDHALEVRREGGLHDAVDDLVEPVAVHGGGGSLGRGVVAVVVVVAAAVAVTRRSLDGLYGREVVPARHARGHGWLHRGAGLGIAACEAAEVDRVEDAEGVRVVGGPPGGEVERLVAGLGLRERVEVVRDVDVVETVVK